MSKYTTELRYLVGQGFDFQLTEYPLFDPAYRTTLNKKILDHYRYREIGFETPARFRHQLKTKLNEIMPYYNKMYSSELMVINPLYTIDYKETSIKKTDGTSILEGTSTTDRDATTNTDNVQTNNLTDSQTSANTRTDDLIDSQATTNTTTHNLNEATESEDNLLSVDSDAPAGMIAVGDLKSNTYASTANMQENARTGNKLTTGTIADEGNNTTTRTGTVEDEGNVTTTRTGSVTDDGSTVVDETISNTANSTNTINNLDDYVKHVVGHIGNKSHSELLEEFRRTFLNIDLQIIKDLNILFMGVY